MDFKGNTLNGVVGMRLGGNDHVFHFKNDITGMGFALFYVEVNVAADHHGRQRFRS